MDKPRAKVKSCWPEESREEAKAEGEEKEEGEEEEVEEGKEG